MAKKQDETPDQAPDAAQLAEENAALKNQQDQMLDMLVEMRDELDKLKSEGVKAAAAEPTFNEEEAKLDAELEALKQEFKDFEGIEVFEQRVLAGSDANNDIRLMDDPTVTQDPRGASCYWKLRWFNFAREGRASQAEREGYVKVRWSELQSSESLSAALTTEKKDEFVRRGDRGLEVLCKMPQKLYDYKKKRDAARMTGILSSQTKLRDHLSGGVAAMAGANGMNADQAGSFIHGQKDFMVDIKRGEKDTLTIGG